MRAEQDTVVFRLIRRAGNIFAHIRKYRAAHAFCHQHGLSGQHRRDRRLHIGRRPRLHERHEPFGKRLRVRHGHIGIRVRREQVADYFDRAVRLDQTVDKVQFERTSPDPDRAHDQIETASASDRLLERGADSVVFAVEIHTILQKNNCVHSVHAVILCLFFTGIHYTALRLRSM